tara:strand:- start:36 stop:917 length:882 start_codon:yes stop_codon:yes gene_type:complete
MAYKMKGFSYPGASPMKQSKFPNSTKALNRKKNKPSDNKDESLKTNQNIQLNEVSVGGEKTEQKEREIVQAQQIPITSGDPVLEKADYTPIATANKNKKSRAKFRSDVGSFIDGLAGIPEDIVEGVADAGGWVAKGIGNKAKTIKANRLARKQDRIDNPKPEKVKKAKEKTTTKKSNNEIKVKGGASYVYNFNNKKAPESPNANDEYVKPKSKVRVASKKELKKMKPKSKVAKNLGKTLKGAGGMIGEQLITQGISAGIQALLTPKEKQQRDRSNPNLSGFSQMKFGRRKMKE